MAAENSRFHQQALSSQMMLMSNYYTHLGMNFDVNNSGVGVGGGGGGGGGGGMLFSGNPTMINNNNTSSNSQSLRTSQYGSCSDSFLIDTVPGLKHDTGLAVEWTVEEQYKLDEGLMKFANEPRIMKYIKIASTLREKNVRDVALRCRWITRKRRKQEDYSLVKKLKDRKDKSAEMSSKSSASASLMSLAPYSLSMSHHGHGDVLPSGELLRTRRLLEENNHALNRISANLSTLKGSILDGGRGYACNQEEAFASNYQGTNGRIELLNTGITTVKHLLQDNVDLFFQTKNNLTAILNNMKNMPGIMSQMPPLPVFLNEELASSLSPSSSQPMMFGCRSAIQLKQEPAC